MATRGRPRNFDREQALRSAIDVFWARGYDGATLEELQAAMGGIAPPSFYAAFGSKDRLFREAVELYRATMARACSRALEAPTAREAIGGLLRERRRAVLQRRRPARLPHRARRDQLHAHQQGRARPSAGAPPGGAEDHPRSAWPAA